MSSHDLYAHTNPAFSAVCTRWVAEGFQLAAEDNEHVVAKHISPFWIMVSLALLAPVNIRKLLPQTSSGHLTKLMYEHPEWRFGLADAVKAWVDPFWAGMRLGTASGILSLAGGRIQATGSMLSPINETQKDLRKRALTLGKIIAKEKSDEAVSFAFGLSVNL